MCFVPCLLPDRADDRFVLAISCQLEGIYRIGAGTTKALKFRGNSHIWHLKFRGNDYSRPIKFRGNDDFDPLEFWGSHKISIFALENQLMYNRLWKEDFFGVRFTKHCLNGKKKARASRLFCKRFSSRVKDPILVYTKDLGKDGDTILLPVYMEPFL